MIGEFDQEALEAIRNFANVKAVVVNEKESRGYATVYDLYFYDTRTVFEDTPRIAELAGSILENGGLSL